MTIETDIQQIHKHVDSMISHIKEDEKVEESEVQLIIELMQSVEDKFADLLAGFGVEIGDERID